MRVLHLVHWLNRGGIETWLLSLLRSTSRDAVEMDVLCKGGGPGALADEAKSLGAAVLHVPLAPTHVTFGRRLLGILRAGRYDLVHNHLEGYSGFAVWIAKRAEVPVISSYHNTDFPAQTWIGRPGLRQLRAAYVHASIRYAVTHSDHVTGCSEAVLEALGRFGLSDGQASVLTYGIETRHVGCEGHRERVRKELGVTESSRVVLHVGRFVAQKNHPAVLRIFQKVCTRVPNARLVLVGDGPLRPQIEQLARELGVNNASLFLGYRDDVRCIMSASDVLLMPSIHEGFGLVTLEAGATSLPVVGTSIPGLREAVANGKTGLLYDVGDEEGMAAAVVRLLEDERMRRDIGETARERVLSTFSIEASRDRVVALYRSVLDQRCDEMRWQSAAHIGDEHGGLNS